MKTICFIFSIVLLVTNAKASQSNVITYTGATIDELKEYNDYLYYKASWTKPTSNHPGYQTAQIATYEEKDGAYRTMFMDMGAFTRQECKDAISDILNSGGSSSAQGRCITTFARAPDVPDTFKLRLVKVFPDSLKMESFSNAKSCYASLTENYNKPFSNKPFSFEYPYCSYVFQNLNNNKMANDSVKANKPFNKLGQVFEGFKANGNFKGGLVCGLNYTPSDSIFRNPNHANSLFIPQARRSPSLPKCFKLTKGTPVFIQNGIMHYANIQFYIHFEGSIIKFDGNTLWDFVSPNEK